MPSTINELSVIKLGNKGHALADLFHHGSICLRLSLSLIGLQRYHNFHLHHCLFLTGHEPVVRHITLSLFSSTGCHSAPDDSSLSFKSSPVTVSWILIFLTKLLFVVDLLCHVPVSNAWTSMVASYHRWGKVFLFYSSFWLHWFVR